MAAITIFFAILGLLLNLAIVIALVRKYLRTRDAGFVWLGVAVVVWPLASRLAEAGERGLIERTHGQFMKFYPFTLLQSGQITLGGLVTSSVYLLQLAGSCLLLMAILRLSQGRRASVR